ncbi:helix-turn-helix transcriptional regulator [Citrobacter sp. wls830]|uniref:helix-turn-helix domain-containing protein n=1 Tax=Kluyvera georgiana TaxID=73098 RepID=UPI000806F2F2|nr:helix-turn-helix transcriptional regulator [Kluyvera georgiana]TKT99223.1 helix-turn-helix transcriptional regulator [Citrobacter sp. wls830]
MSTDEKARLLYDEGKDTFKDRLRQLVGNRSLRAASKAWELPYSTLNNYFEKDTIPSLYVAQKIAKIEGVSLEWLASGGERTKEAPAAYHVGKDAHSSAKIAWQLMFDMLEPEEADALIRLIHRKGIEHILSLDSKK